MVRLKAVSAENNQGANKFQFHYGTIKSLYHHYLASNQRISIPLWYD